MLPARLCFQSSNHSWRGAGEGSMSPRAQHMSPMCPRTPTRQKIMGMAGQSHSDPLFQLLSGHTCAEQLGETWGGSKPLSIPPAIPGGVGALRHAEHPKNWSKWYGREHRLKIEPSGDGGRQSQECGANGRAVLGCNSPSCAAGWRGTGGVNISKGFVAASLSQPPPPGAVASPVPARPVPGAVRGSAAQRVRAAGRPVAAAGGRTAVLMGRSCGEGCGQVGGWLGCSPPHGGGLFSGAEPELNEAA